MIGNTEIYSPTPYAAAPYASGVANGLGGVGLVGLLGLNSFMENNQGYYGNGSGTEFNTLPLLNQISDLRKDVQEGATETHKLGNEIANLFHNQTIAFDDRFTALNSNLSRDFCDLNATIAKYACDAAMAAKEAEISGIRNTQNIKDQATTFQMQNNEQFCAVKELVREDGDKTRSVINANRIEDLRDQLAAERRHSDRRESDIHITNVNQNTQTQLQAQLQNQTSTLANCLNLLGDQISRANNSVVNLGTMLGTAQTNANTSTKVNA